MAMDSKIQFIDIDAVIDDMRKEKLNTKSNINTLSEDIKAMFEYNCKDLISCVHCIEIHRNYNQIKLKIPFQINGKTYHILKYIFISHTNNITQQVTDALSIADRMITNIKLGGIR